jgi:SAM-dependent methyltransferase
LKPTQLSWPRYLRLGVGNRLSRWGERLNIHWLIYNPIHFRHFHEHGLMNAPGVVAALTETFPSAHSYLDVGAGSGAFSAEVHRRGKKVIACENSRASRRMAKKQGVDCRRFDLNADPPSEIDEQFDLAFCFEVAEHLPPALGKRLVTFMCENARVIVFTAAHPGQGGTGHINEQPKAYWIERFRDCGFTLDESATQSLAQCFARLNVPGPWFHQNIMVFTISAPGVI